MCHTALRRLLRRQIAHVVKIIVRAFGDCSALLDGAASKRPQKGAGRFAAHHSGAQCPEKGIVVVSLVDDVEVADGAFFAAGDPDEVSFSTFESAGRQTDEGLDVKVEFGIGGCQLDFFLGNVIEFDAVEGANKHGAAQARRADILAREKEPSVGNI